jgi:cysteine synthase A
VLKKEHKELKVFAVEPVESQVIKGGEPSPHKIMGIGPGFIPGTLDRSVLDGTVAVDKQEAYLFARRAAQEEGIFMGISSGASLAAVNKKLTEIQKGARILTFNYDTGERYLSVNDLF